MFDRAAATDIAAISVGGILALVILVAVARDEIRREDTATKDAWADGRKLFRRDEK